MGEAFRKGFWERTVFKTKEEKYNVVADQLKPEGEGQTGLSYSHVAVKMSHWTCRQGCRGHSWTGCGQAGLGYNMTSLSVGNQKDCSRTILFVLSFLPEAIHHFFLVYRTFHSLSYFLEAAGNSGKGQKARILLSSLVTDLLSDLVHVPSSWSSYL